MTAGAGRMPPKMVLYGGTGQAKVVRPIFEHFGSVVVAVIDDTPGLPPPFPDVPVYQGWDKFEASLRGDDRASIGFSITIANPHGRVRLRLHDQLASKGLTAVTAVHPTAWIADNSYIEAGCQLLAGSTVCAEARVGRQCILGTNAVLEHEAVLGDGSGLATGAIVLGLTKTGVNCGIGARAIVLSRLNLGDDVVVGAGMVAERDLEAGARLMPLSNRTV